MKMPKPNPVTLCIMLAPKQNTMSIIIAVVVTFLLLINCKVTKKLRNKRNKKAPVLAGAFLSVTDILSFWQVECYGHLVHLFHAHTLGCVAHVLGSNIYLGALAQYVNLIKSIDDVGIYGEHTMFFP